MKYLKKISILALLMMAFFLVPAHPAQAWQQLYSEKEDTVVLAEDQVIGDDLLIAGRNVFVNGTVEGDLVCFGQNITINGTINGDVIAFCASLIITGQVKEDVRIAAQDIRLQGSVLENFSAAASKIILQEDSRVGGNVTLAAEKASIQGPVQGSIHGYTGTMELAGPVGINVTAYTGELRIKSGANIGGKLTYNSSQQAEIAPDAKIAGGVIRIPPEPTNEKAIPSRWDKVVGFLISFASVGLIWFLWHLIVPKSLENLEQVLIEAPWSAVGWGLLFLFAVPVAAILLLFTIVGIPLSVLGLIAYGVTLYLGKIVVGSWLGHLAAERSGKPELVNHSNLTAVAGILLVMLVAMIPYLGFWVKLVIGATGLGCVFLAVRGIGSQGIEESN